MDLSSSAYHKTEGFLGFLAQKSKGNSGFRRAHLLKPPKIWYFAVMALPFSKQTLGLIIAVFSTLAFACYAPGARGAYADGANAVFIILFTTFFRALGFLVFCLINKRRIFANKTDTKIGFINGFFQAASITCIFSSLAFIPAPLMTIILFTHTLMLLLVLFAKKEMAPDMLTISTTLSALLGLTLVLGIWDLHLEYSLLGCLLAFGGALATMIRLYAIGQEAKTRDPAIIGAETFLVAFLFVSALVFFKSPVMPATEAGWTWAAFAALGSMLGTFGMFYGIALIGAFQWSLFSKTEPIFVAIIAATFLHEILTLWQYLGMALVIASLVLYQMKDILLKKIEEK